MLRHPFSLKFDELLTQNLEFEEVLDEELAQQRVRIEIEGHAASAVVTSKVPMSGSIGAIPAVRIL